MNQVKFKISQKAAFLDRDGVINEDTGYLNNIKDFKWIEGAIDALKILNFLKSNGEARRLIRGNGAKINDIIINDENYTLSNKDYKNGKVKISYGKKKHGILILN